VYAVGLLILGIVLYRVISTATPDDLKDYIIKNEKISRAYKNLQDDFKMYKIDIENTNRSFALGDSLYVHNLYYLESAENLQMTIRGKNNRIEQMVEYYSSLSDAPFKFYIKVTTDTGSGDDETGETTEENGENTDNSGQDYIILETVDEKTSGKDTDRYRYFVLSFDGVKINYAKTKVELYLFMNNTSREEAAFSEDNYIARFTLFDINTPKTKVQAKKFILE